MQRNIEIGKGGGFAPYGYQLTDGELEINEEKAAVHGGAGFGNTDGVPMSLEKTECRSAYTEFYRLIGEGYKAMQDGHPSTVEEVREKMVNVPLEMKGDAHWKLQYFSINHQLYSFDGLFSNISVVSRINRMSQVLPDFIM